jgi:U32 family peptidase
VAHDDEVSGMLAWCRSGAPVVVGNLGVLWKAAQHRAEVEAHWSLNAVNSLSVEQLAELGARRAWMSPELTSHQIADIAVESRIPVGMAVWGFQEIMVTEHCVLMAQGPCNRQCESCTRRAEQRFLLDRKGYRFPIRTDLSGRTHVYNSVPLDLVPALDEVVGTGVGAVRLDLQMMTGEDAAIQVRRAIRVLAAVESGVDIPEKRSADSSTTTGHFFRGML